MTQPRRRLDSAQARAVIAKMLSHCRLYRRWAREDGTKAIDVVMTDTIQKIRLELRLARVRQGV